VVKFFTFKGAKTDAKKRLMQLAALAEAGSLPDEHRLLGSLLDAWEAGLDVSPKSRERYLEIMRLQVRPYLGALKVRSISPSRLETFYGDLRAGVGPDGKPGRRPLSPKTIGHVHRLLTQVFSLAERDRVILSNPARHAKRPREAGGEVEILKESEIRTVLQQLSGHPLSLIVGLALSTGMRRGEILGLRWQDVGFDAGRILVSQSVEETRAGLALKSPKTKSGRRQLSVPASIMAELRSHRRKQAEERLQLGLGKEPDGALVFRMPEGGPLRPNKLSCEWRRAVVRLKLPPVSFHALRHSHASQLIAGGMDVVSVSKRLGHASPNITLGVYSHLFHPTDATAADLFENAFGATIGANKSEPAGTK
jgi:integrase